MKKINFNQGDFVWIGDWTLKGSWWVRHALVYPNSIPKVETISYAVFDEGRPMSYDTHEKARQYEEDQLLVKFWVTL